MSGAGTFTPFHRRQNYQTLLLIGFSVENSALQPWPVRIIAHIFDEKRDTKTICNHGDHDRNDDEKKRQQKSKNEKIEIKWRR